MAQSGYTPILIYASGTATNVPLAINLTSSALGAELALNYADGKLYYKNSSGTVTLLASTAGASGDVVGPASATDNALARFDLTTGKLIQNSVGILSDAGALSGITDISASGSITLSGGTANGVAYLNGSKVLTTGSALVFDGSNLGVGVTPSSWGSGITVIQLAKDTSVSSHTTGGNIFVNSNTYYNGSNWIYSATRGASQYQQNNGAHIWYQAGSGTAGNAISFTQAMTLDGSGNLGVGTTSPNSRLQVSNSSASSNAIAQFTNGTTGTGAGNGLYVGVDTSNEATIFNFYNSALKFGTNGSERARIDSSGNLLVGTTSSSGLVGNNAYSIGGNFSTVYGSGSIASSATTVTTLPTRDGATYLFSCQNISDAGAPASYGATSIISQEGSVLAATAIQTASFTVIGVSGLNIQITSTLATKTYRWSLVRIL